MKIINASQYPDEAILRLVRFAFAGIPAQGVGVYVGDFPGQTGRGLAYNGLPRKSQATPNGLCPFLSSDKVTRYVSLEFAGPHQFPANNIMSRVIGTRQLPITDDILFDEQGRKRTGREAVAYLSGLIGEDEKVHHVDRPRRHVVVATYRYGPYGGRGSVLIEYADWQEAVLAYAAHEARHIWQFVWRDRERQETGNVVTRMSEADAERYALGVLGHFRQHRAAVLSASLAVPTSFPTTHGTQYTVTRLLTPPERLYGPG